MDHTAHLPPRSRLGLLAALAASAFSWGAAAQEAPAASPPPAPPTAPAADAGTPAPPPEILIILPPKPQLVPPPPPPAPVPQYEPAPSFEEVHKPRPRYEPWQIAMELGGSSAAVLLGSGAVFAVSLIPISVASIFNAPPEVANAFLYGFSLAGAVTIPLFSTIAIEKLKVFSYHYKLDGLGWWLTYGSGLGLQLISSALTVAFLNVDTYFAAPHLIVFAILTPLAQTAVANLLPTPRDPLAPILGLRLLPERGGGFVPAVSIASARF